MQYKLYYRHFYDISESLPDSSKNDYDTILLSSFYFLMLMYLLLLNHAKWSVLYIFTFSHNIFLGVCQSKDTYCILITYLTVSLGRMQYMYTYSFSAVDCYSLGPNFAIFIT